MTGQFRHDNRLFHLFTHWKRLSCSLEA